MATPVKEPEFVNLSKSDVLIFDEKKSRVLVSPYARFRGTRPEQFIVKGEWYRQFVSHKGPLSPRPVVSSKSPATAGPVAAQDTADETAVPVGIKPAIEAKIVAQSQKNNKLLSANQRVVLLNYGLSLYAGDKNIQPLPENLAAWTEPMAAIVQDIQTPPKV